MEVLKKISKFIRYFFKVLGLFFLVIFVFSFIKLYIYYDLDKNGDINFTIFKPDCYNDTYYNNLETALKNKNLTFCFEFKEINTKYVEGIYGTLETCSYNDGKSYINSDSNIHSQTKNMSYVDEYCMNKFMERFNDPRLCLFKTQDLSNDYLIPENINEYYRSENMEICIWGYNKNVNSYEACFLLSPEVGRLPPSPQEFCIRRYFSDKNLYPVEDYYNFTTLKMKEIH